MMGAVSAGSVTDVSDDVWAKYLENRDAPATYWRIPCADHYLQVDEPELIVDILHAMLADDAISPKIDGENCQAVKIH